MTSRKKQQQQPSQQKSQPTSILGDMVSQACFATREGWHKYQELLVRLRVRQRKRITNGEEIQPAQGFTTRTKGHTTPKNKNQEE